MATERIQIILTESGSRVVAASLDQIGRSSAQANQAVNLFKSTLASLGAGLGFREIAAYSDVFVGMQNRLQIVTKSSEELKNVTNELFRVANTTRTSFESNVILFSRLAQATDTLGISQKELLKITETINKTIAISGANSIEAKNALIQFSQGLSSGTLRGDELRSVLEQLPGLAQQIAKGMGVAYGELRRLAKEGALTPQVILQAIQKQQTEIDALFAKTTPTIAQSFQRLENEVIKFIGNSKEMNTAMRLVSAGIIFVADNLGLLSNAVLAITAIFATRFIFAALAPATVALIGMAASLGTTAIAMGSAGSVAAATSIAFAGTATSAGILTAALSALRVVFTFLTATPLGLAITAVATVFGAFALTTNTVKASTSNYKDEIERLKNPIDAASEAQNNLKNKTNETTDAFDKQLLLRQKARLDEIKKELPSQKNNLNAQLSIAGAKVFRSDPKTTLEISEIRKLLDGTVTDAERASEAILALGNSGKISPDTALKLSAQIIAFKEASEAAGLYESAIKKATLPTGAVASEGTRIAIEQAAQLKKELEKASQDAFSFSNALVDLSAKGVLSADALKSTADATKLVKDNAGPSAEALKLITEQFDRLGVNAPGKAAAAAEAVKLLDDAIAKTQTSIDSFSSQIVSALDAIAQKRLELNGADAVQQELQNLTNKFKEGSITADQLRTALGALQGANPSFDLSGINGLIGKALQAIGVINSLRNAASGVAAPGTEKFGPAIPENFARDRENAFVAEQKRIAGLSKRQKSIEDRERSLRSDAEGRGINLSDARGLATNLVDAEASNKGGKGGGGGKKDKSEAEKEVEAYKKQLEEIRKPQEEYARNIAAIDRLQREGTITNEEYAKSYDKIRLKMLETKDDAVFGLERATIKLAQEQRDAAKYVEEAYTAIQKPLEDYKNKLAALNFMLERGVVSTQRYAVEIDKLKLKALEGNTDPLSGFERGFIKIKQTADDTASGIETAMTNAFKGAEDAFVKFVQTGKLDFKSLADSIVADIARISFRQAISGIFGNGQTGSNGSGSGGGFLSGLGNLFGGGGSFLGGGGGGGTDAFSGGTLSFGLPSFATGGEFTVPGGGGVDGSTVAFRASAGERVSIKRPGQQDGTSSGQRPVVFNIQTPDAASFKASQSQIQAATLRAMRAGARNN